MTYETPNGKPILIVRNTFGNYAIKFEQGGELPQELTGAFLKYREAEFAIQKYLDRKEDTENGKGRKRATS